MALLDAIVLLAPVITAVLFNFFSPALQLSHSEGVMLAVLGRSLPLAILVLYLFMQPHPSRNPENRLDEIVRRTVAEITMISLLFSSVGDTCLAVDSFYLLGILFLTTARLVSQIGVCYWWRSWRKLNPHWTLTSFLSGGYRSLFGQAIIDALVVAVILSLPTTRFTITLLYALLSLIVAATQVHFWLVCRNKGTSWGAVSGILLVLSHLPMIVTGHGRMAGGWSVVVYYMAQTAYALSAIHASIGRASI